MEVLLAHPDTWETFLVFVLIELYIKSNLLEFTEADREILERKDGWLNDNLMDAG